MAVEKIVVSINTRPVSVRFNCPHCEEDIEIDYKDFEAIAGDYCDWCYTEIECPDCESKCEIEQSNWG